MLSLVLVVLGLLLPDFGVGSGPRDLACRLVWPFGSEVGFGSVGFGYL